MGAFFIADGTASATARKKLDDWHSANGFALAHKIKTGAFWLHLYRKLDGSGGLFLDHGEQSFASLAGELLYCGRDGEEGVRLYCADLAAGTLKPDRVIGHFAILLKDQRNETLRLFTDPLGFYQVYYNDAAGVVSSSFLALLELSPRLTADPSGIYEYAWNGATFGGKTFVREIRRLPAGSTLEFGATLRRVDSSDGVCFGAAAEKRSLDSYAEEHSSRLRRLFTDLAEAHGDRLQLSFSGGFDSRLMLAGLKAASVRPRLFVYGDAGDADVAIARAVAAGEGLPLDVVDKGRMDGSLGLAPPERFERDLAGFDAWKTDGIFDDGTDYVDRLSRHREHRVPLNGSLGEIYRNFFYIPDSFTGRPIALADVASSFFSTYAPAASTDRFSPDAYRLELVRVFQHELGTRETQVPRGAVEALYPLVRGRYWTGRDASLNLRFGRMYFPFMQPQLIAGTYALPIAFKNYGRLEARMIEMLDPAVAAYPSSYGFRFCDPPPLKHRVKNWATLFRPPWLRRQSYRLRFARPRGRPAHLANEALAALMDPSLPCMRNYFLPDRVHDPDAFNRVATMEYIFQRYGVHD